MLVVNLVQPEALLQPAALLQLVGLLHIVPSSKPLCRLGPKQEAVGEVPLLSCCVISGLCSSCVWTVRCNVSVLILCCCYVFLVTQSSCRPSAGHFVRWRPAPGRKTGHRHRCYVEHHIIVALSRGSDLRHQLSASGGRKSVEHCNSPSIRCRQLFFCCCTQSWFKYC
jgi:hypothetical protein